MKRSIVAAYCSLFLGSMDASGQGHQSCTGPHLGTWKLLSYTTEDLATGQKTNLLGAHPSGFLGYGSDCRMYAILIKDGRRAPATSVSTDAELIDLYSGLISYAGSYSIKGDEVRHFIDASWNQSWTGTTQVRRFRINDNHLYITTPPAKNPLTGKESSSVLVWSKVD